MLPLAMRAKCWFRLCVPQALRKATSALRGLHHGALRSSIIYSQRRQTCRNEAGRKLAKPETTQRALTDMSARSTAISVPSLVISMHWIAEHLIPKTAVASSHVDKFDPVRLGNPIEYA